MDVVSPRPSAAHHHAHLAGPRAARELRRLRRRLRADDLVLCLEAGVPFTKGAGSARHRREAAALGRALRRFGRVTVVVTGDLEIQQPDALTPFWAAVHEVVARSDQEALVVVEQLAPTGTPVRVDPRGYPEPHLLPASYRGLAAGVPPALVIRRRAAEAREAAQGTRGVTPHGPIEWAWYEQPRRLVSSVARRILGRHADAVRAQLVRALGRGERRPRSPDETAKAR